MLRLNWPLPLSPSRALAQAAAFALMLAQVAPAATKIWAGAAGNSLWSEAGNWDGGERGIWEVETVRLATTDTDRTWKVAIDWRMDKAEAWSRTDPVTADERGIARISVSAVEFRLVLTHEDRTKTDLERIEVELRGEGRRSIKRLTV